MIPVKPIQLDFVDSARTQTLSWAKSFNIELHTIDTVIPFLPTDIKLEVWLFFETDNIVKRYIEDGTDEKVKKYYLSILQQIGYPTTYLQNVSFQLDSHENVERNFEGSYFYRLR